MGEHSLTHTHAAMSYFFLPPFSAVSPPSTAPGTTRRTHWSAALFLKSNSSIHQHGQLHQKCVYLSVCVYLYSVKPA